MLFPPAAIAVRLAVVRWKQMWRISSASVKVKKMGNEIL
jgi:hypothetical protein